MSNISQMISDLETQRVALDRAINALREMQGAGPIRASAGAGAPGKRARKRRQLSAEGRQRIIEAAKKRWAAVRAAKAKKK